MTDTSMQPMRILAIDDDLENLQIVRLSLEQAGFHVLTANSGKQGLEMIKRHGLPHLAIVDINMPMMDGITFAKKVRATCDLPIIMLTAIKTEQTIVDSLDEFAEDYITKPFSPSELIARVKRVLRRVRNFAYTEDPLVEVDERLKIDLPGRQLIVNGNGIRLTPTEAKLLHILLRNEGRPVTIEFLLRRIWPHQDVAEDRLRVHVHRLRQKIEPDAGNPRHIVAERGTGYRFLGRTI